MTTPLMAAIERHAGRGRYDKIVQILQNIMPQLPARDRPAAHGNLGQALMLMGQYGRAVGSFDAALAGVRDPGHLYQRSVCRLHLGHLDAFRDYRHRWVRAGAADHRARLGALAPAYVDEWGHLAGLRGGRLLVSGEQGLGDELLFSRVLPLLGHLAVTLVASPSLCSFFRHNYPGLTVLPSGQLPPGLPPFGAVSTLGDLFAAWVTEHGRLPPLPRYTAGDPVPAAPPTGRPRVAYVYRAGTNEPGETRDVPLGAFAGLAEQFDLVSFQLPVAPVVFGSSVAGRIGNFMDTANLVSGMDLAVTCDTSFAHLCLGLGVPTVVLHDTFVDWRWKLPLYPAAHLELWRGNLCKKLLRFIAGLPGRAG